MNEIISKTTLVDAITVLEIYAPQVALKAEPGQFVAVRAIKGAREIPFPIMDDCKEKGTLTILCKAVDEDTVQLSRLRQGERIDGLAGPLGLPSRLDHLRRAVVVAGGMGCAKAFPIAKKLHTLGTEVHSLLGFRRKDRVMMEEDFRRVSDQLIITTNDGSYGKKGLVTVALEAVLKKDNYDAAFAMGPLFMMKAVSELTKRYHTRTVVSINPAIVDSTSLCPHEGGRLFKTENDMPVYCVGFECDGHRIDFDEAIRRDKTTHYMNAVSEK
ncbi:sulfide/dihydroorotate dehydrogenase-like FAD/NAD-binding protein [Ruminococcaceae bacterium OttesenSCG-928-I18]|nr:sulfide/dihydroorotate dehydrogenase-like FAD/NAD-binding protein [Ruminococcaceae bacterium OttesenSCG-928-I18]